MAGRVIRCLALALVACALVVTPAQARVLRAGDILPPGQSGHVTAAGLSSGTGSPHLTDQIDLFVRFGFKPHAFNQPAVSDPQPIPGQGVEDVSDGVHSAHITRDAFGVPTITASSDANVWFGAGHAVAQDRLFQLELFRRATTGRLSEILGKGYLEDDIQVRRDFYTAAELNAQIAKLPTFFKERIDAYRDGVNMWIQATRMDGSKLPAEFAAVGLPGPADWTVEDTAAIGVYLARTVPNGDGEELNNARGLKAVGPRLFSQIIPLRTPGHVATVPRREGAFPSQPGRTRRQEVAAFARSRRFLSRITLPTRDEQRAGASSTRLARQGGIGRTGGSNMWAIRGKGRRASLFNGPQVGYSIPELFVELELHAPGLDVRGVTAAGVPVVGIGHNGHVAWGFTSGLTDENDQYIEDLVGEESYRYKGQVRQMDCRDETFTYRPPPSDFLGVVDFDPTDPEVPDPADPSNTGSETRRLCRTVHGPVQYRAHGHAYTRKWASWKREIESIEGLSGFNTARSVREVDRALARVTWNENLMAADDRGHIGFWHPGLLPIRPRNYDERLPYPGTGEAEWRGFLPVGRRPHVIDPRQGYLFSWNNMPSAGWTNGDAPAKERIGGPLHRAAWLERVVRRAKSRGGGYQATADVDKLSGTIAQQRPLSRSALVRARRGARGHARVVLDAILKWSGTYHRTGSDGKVDGGLAAWDAFGPAAKEVRLGRYGEGVNSLGHSAGSSHKFEVTSLESFSLRTLGPRGYRQAAEKAYDELVKKYGSGNPSAWRQTRPTYSASSQGAAAFPEPFPFFDRGTWLQVVELGP
jgi:penicillin amidase